MFMLYHCVIFALFQALDDITPEQRTIYTLQLNSATGGASLSAISSATMADIVFVASDNPHGEFVFDLPEVYITTEDRYSVGTYIHNTVPELQIRCIKSTLLMLSLH